MPNTAYSAEELTELTKVVGAIEMSLVEKPAEDTEYPFELLEALLEGAREYYESATAGELASAMFELGIFASKHNLVINAYALSNGLYNMFT
jgi:hypothetical protein